jgi:DoxX-like protein
VRFVAVCEVLDAVGLILPGLTRIRRDLTSLAAAGLLIIMGGTTITTAAAMDIASATLPFVCGVVAAAVARGRASWLAYR